MKRTTRYAIAGIGLALFGLAGCMGIILSSFESSHNVQSVQYTIKTEPIEESKLESVEPQYIYVEPQIVEQESEIERYKRVAIESVYDYNNKENRNLEPNLSFSQLKQLHSICTEIEAHGYSEFLKNEIVKLIEEIEKNAIKGL